MLDLPDFLPPLAVFPVLVGPLQTLLALLPAILVGVGSMVFAVFKPGGIVKLVRFCWRQKLFFGAMASTIAAWQYGFPSRLLRGQTPGLHAANNNSAGTNWDSVRGGPLRWGRGPGNLDPTAAGVIWTTHRDNCVLSSPAVSGERVFFSTATGIGPFSPEGRGAIVCVDAHSGKEIWRYGPDNYRATFSSPVVSGNSVVCGEGLHQVEDARITCLDAHSGQLRWEFRTKSHVESTAAIAHGRVFIGAGSDGFYCLSVDPDEAGRPQVLWHLEADDFADCESSPVVSDGVVYFGLGEGGTAVCAVQANTGTLLWKLATPYPVFAPPTVANGKLLIATGNGNFVQSAADLLEMKLQILRDDGASEQQLMEARERLKPVGEVWCIDLATRAVDWKFPTGDAILGAIVSGDSLPDTSGHVSDDAIYFGSRDGHLYRISQNGELLNKYPLHEPLISSPALGWKHVYCTTASGRLFCLDRNSLKPIWDSSLGPGTTFSSSPTIAFGHIYIGTAQQGFRCVGRPGEPEPSVWTQGERGGSADDVPIPDVLELRWQYPADEEVPLVATAPLMALDGAIYVAGTRNGQSELVKLNVRGSDSTQRQAWSRHFERPIEVALVGCGDRLCVIEGGTNSAVLKLHCLAASDGTRLWSLTVAGPNAITRSSKSTTPQAGISLDSKRVYAWTGEDQLGCFDLATGMTVWDQSAVGSGLKTSPTRPPDWGIGVPVLANDLLFAITQQSTGDPVASEKWAMLSARDAQTGILLWRCRFSHLPVGNPIVEGQQILIPLERNVAVHRLIDGLRVRTQPMEGKPTVRELPVEYGKPIQPAIFLQGRACFATDRGKIVCLGGGPP